MEHVATTEHRIRFKEVELKPKQDNPPEGLSDRAPSPHKPKTVKALRRDGQPRRRSKRTATSRVKGKGRAAEPSEEPHGDGGDDVAMDVTQG